VAARPFAAASHRGGTLTEVNSYLPQVDPAHDYDIGTPALAGVYDGLAAFRKAGGGRWDTLVPDLAVTLPRPADGGTTYTFRLRRGIRYSSGAFVRASDFRRGIQRQLSIGDVPTYYEGILGAPACHRNPRRCDLSGIVTDDAAGTVTFRLGQADPDFLDKLALLMAAPAPPGAAGHLMDRAPFLPGTGPYMISRYRPDSSLTLVRNPRFRQWSYAAQPAGYPDVIRFEQMADPRQQEQAVEAGRADLVDTTSFNGQPSRPLAIRYPTRVHSTPKLITTFLFLNTRQPPFSSLKARQALSYAIDRARIIQLLGLDSPEATPTCQVLPTGSPSYQRYCPYTAGAQDGAWHGPDLATAIRLAHESGTTQVPVTVWNNQTDFGKPAGAYLADLLRQLGYRATVRNVPQDQYHAAIHDSSRKIQLGLAGWEADIPIASDFFLPVLTCRSFYQDPASTANVAGFCDPQADKLVSQAQAAQQTDPAAARKLWAKLDRLVTDQAPWVPILNASETVFVSARVGNYQESPSYAGPLLDQIWIR
jgi:peptide/nickel transport system substrate-binding protein